MTIENLDTKRNVQPMNEDEVGEFLLEHPDFFSRNPEVLVNMRVPDRYEDTPRAGVVDIQTVMLDRLKDEIGNLTACTQDVIETSRTNMNYQTRTHAAVLALLNAKDAQHLGRIIGDDLGLLLDVDAVTYGFEHSPPRADIVGLANVRMVPVGFVDSIVGEGSETQLVRDIMDDGDIFGEAAPLVRSAALARIRSAPGVPMGFLALGVRTAGTFHGGQGAELLNFLARVVEARFHSWLMQDT